MATVQPARASERTAPRVLQVPPSSTIKAREHFVGPGIVMQGRTRLCGLTERERLQTPLFNGCGPARSRTIRPRTRRKRAPCRPDPDDDGTVEESPEQILA